MLCTRPTPEPRPVFRVAGKQEGQAGSKLRGFVLYRHVAYNINVYLVYRMGKRAPMYCAAKAVDLLCAVYSCVHAA
jgi:hypothetical protein